MKKKGFIVLGIIFFIVVIVVISSIIWYEMSIKQPNTDSSQDIQAVVEIKTGTSTKEILNELKQNKVIKSTLASKIYIALHDVKGLQAGKYLFTGNENLQVVLETLSLGKVMDETVNITFLEGKNMRYIASTIAENTNNTANDVYELLELIGRKRGCIVSGGNVDMEKAAKAFLDDLKSGKIGNISFENVI